MPIQKTEIKPEHAVRLKRLLDEQNINQKELSRRLKERYSPLSQQLLSRIMTGKAPLTKERANDIVALFPFYRAEWLLGEVGDAFRFQNADKKYSTDMLNVGVTCLMKSLGYGIVPAAPMRDDLDSIVDETERAKAYMKSFTESFNAGYIIRKGDEECHINTFELRELKNHIQRIAKYSLHELMEKADA